MTEIILFLKGVLISLLYMVGILLTAFFVLFLAIMIVKVWKERK